MKMVLGIIPFLMFTYAHADYSKENPSPTPTIPIPPNDDTNDKSWYILNPLTSEPTEIDRYRRIFGTSGMTNIPVTI
jgi:hypothetical protein